MTADCVRALLASSLPDVRVVIVDNGSADGSVEALRNDFPSLTILANAENLGFSRGCNVGLEHALAQGATHVALINNDLLVDPKGLEEGMRAFEAHPRAGAVTGKIYTSDGKTLWQAGGAISRVRVSGQVRGHFEPDRGQYDKPELTGWASGAMSIFTAKALRAVGCLPPEYFFGQEEWDISTNLLLHSFEIVYVPTFVGHHGHGGSYRVHPILNDYGSTRNRLIYADKYVPAPWRIAWKAVFWLHLRFVMPRKLSRLPGHLSENVPVRVKAMQLAFSRHERGKPVTIDEFREASRELGVKDNWAPES